MIYMQAVGAQPLGDRRSDAGAASGNDRGLHAQASAIKNRPSDYENRTLGYCDSARQHRKRIRTGETFEGFCRSVNCRQAEFCRSA
jgi:hypothetical protein